MLTKNHYPEKWWGIRKNHYNNIIIGKSYRRRDIIDTQIEAAKEGKIQALPNKFIVIDTRDRLYHEYQKTMKNMGYKTKKLLINGVGITERYDPFKYISSASDISVLSDLISSVGNQDTNYPIDVETFLLNIVFAIVVDQGQTFETASNILKLTSFTGAKSTVLEKMIKDIGDESLRNYASVTYERLIKCIPNVLAASYANVMAKMSSFEHTYIESMFKDDTIKDDLLSDEKFILFIEMPEENSILNIPTTVLVGQLLNYAMQNIYDLAYIVDDYDILYRYFPRIEQIAAINRTVYLVLLVENAMHLYKKMDFSKLANKMQTIVVAKNFVSDSVNDMVLKYIDSPVPNLLTVKDEDMIAVVDDKDCVLHIYKG